MKKFELTRKYKFALVALSLSILAGCSETNYVDCLCDDDCPTDYGCRKGVCVAEWSEDLACSFSGKRCDEDGRFVQICVDNQLETDQICKNGCKDGACISNACDFTEIKCQNLDVVACHDGQLSTIEHCLVACENGACKASQQDCTYTGKQCNGKNVVECKSGTESIVETCSTSCQNGACVASQGCTYTGKQCNGKNVVECKSGTESTVETCSTSCENGACVNASAGKGNFVISQIYPGGGNDYSDYKDRYVVIQNLGGADKLEGASIQWMGSEATAPVADSYVCALPSLTLQAGGYALVTVSERADGTPLPLTADYVCPKNMGGMSSKHGAFVLAKTTKALDFSDMNEASGVTSSSSIKDVLDIVGYGSLSKIYYGSRIDSLNSNKAAFRKNCQNTKNNKADFTVNSPSPRNSGSTPAKCQ